MRMRIFFVLIAFVLLSFSQNVSEVFEEQTTASAVPFVSDWKFIAVAALMVSSVLVAIGYAIGIGMEMPELRAWAGTELVQIIANALLILVLIGVIGFLDSFILAMVNSSGVSGLYCNIGENCLGKTATFYITDYLDVAEKKAEGVLRNNMIASGWANRRTGIYCTTIYCAQVGIHMALAPQYNLDVDRYMMVFGHYTNLISSLEAQRFFINEISFKIGPFLLALGIVGRSFFFSRRTGGLLIAIAAGIMFFFPMMYIFDWMTLDMMVSGDNIAQQQDSTCPEECSFVPAFAYYDPGGVQLNSTGDVYKLFSEEDREVAENIVAGKAEVATSSAEGYEGKTVYSCNYPEEGDRCPQECRELPYPSIPMCADAEVQEECAALPMECKVIRYVQNIDEEQNEICPADCKIIPPLKSNCDVDDCLESRLDCRVAKRNDLDWRPSIPESVEGAERCNDYPADCPANLTAEESCVWVFPETGSCDDLCAGCPEYCRLEAGGSPLILDNLPTDCLNEDETELSTACQECPSVCKVGLDNIAALNPPPPNCSGCYLEYRLVLYGGDIPEDYTTGACSLENCPTDYRLEIPLSACDQCFESEASYFYDPPINTECTDLCQPPNNAPSKDPEEYSQVDADGLAGTSEIRELSKLLIPAYLLPLFNITATLIFIRGFSEMIGGDIEIPGLMKVF